MVEDRDSKVSDELIVRNDHALISMANLASIDGNQSRWRETEEPQL